jgi:AbrB family looped-hinge helix DNA binding protein
MQEETPKKKIIYGIVTVSDKGQIAIPVELRGHLDIKKGDQLVVLRKEDDSGLILVKLDKMEDLIGELRV